MATSNDPMESTVGDVVIVRDHALELLADELWVEQTWVGVVKIKKPDRTVIDAGGRWQLLPTNQGVGYSVGNTVEVNDSEGSSRFFTLIRSGWSTSVNLTSRSSEDSSQQAGIGRKPSTTSVD